MLLTLQLMDHKRLMTIALNMFFTLIISSCAEHDFMDKTAINSSIIKGEKVKKDDIIFGRPVMIALNYEFNKKQSETKARPQIFGVCSGIMLTQQHVLTAAHCVQNIKSSRVILTTNMYKKMTNEKDVYEIEKAVINKTYIKLKEVEDSKNIFGPEAESNLHDIAVLKLKSKMTDAKTDFSYFITRDSYSYFLSLSTKNKIKNNLIKAVATGYGKQSSLQEPEDTEVQYSKKNGKPKKIRLLGVLKKAELTFDLLQLKDRIIQYNQKDQAGVCSGDSGGPVFLQREGRPYLQGLAIAVYKKTSDDPNNIHNECYSRSMFLNLDYYKAWILESINSMNSSRNI